ncbi:MAG: hypothetical protein JXA21_01045 [Anaerolineae bacterium]|nr:hypothetical protein [Anaerolineae bacterium]
MTGIILLDWAVMAVSIFNTIMLTWLVITVWLNAERRAWGIYLVCGGLLMGAAFFTSHSTIVGHGLNYTLYGMDFWWRLAWIPAIVAPLTWYAAMLWYTGFWEAGQTRLRRRHLPWFALILVLSMSLVGMLVLANPFPSYQQAAQLEPVATPSLGGIPRLILAYGCYNIYCIGLAIDAMRHPEPSTRVMGDLARRRARPWLMTASLALLLASLLVAAVMLWIVESARRHSGGINTGMAVPIAGFDLVIDCVIAVAVVALGRAIVSYEVFAGRSLPRSRLFRHWYRAVILAAAYGVFVGWGLAIHLRLIYAMMMTTMMIAFFYAFFSWDAHSGRERYIERLQPFVASQRLYERLLSPAALSEPGSADGVDAQTPFRALCRDVLETKAAHLTAWGPLAPLAGSSLSYPEDRAAGMEQVAGDDAFKAIVAQFDAPQTLCVPFAPAGSEAMWAVPLWSARGLIGVLVLGEKRSGELYTQEEIEVARACGERLIDARAGAEMARRLMALQRQRLAESQLLDQRARRTLHDEVLPGLHAAILHLSSDGPPAEAITVLSETHHQIADLLREMPTASAPEVARLGLVEALRQGVSHESADAFDEVLWRVQPEAEERARAIPTLTAEVLFYAAREAIRNAARYGRGCDPDFALRLHIRIGWRDGLVITVEDNGVGIGEAQRSAGSGQGLALHTTMMAVIGGMLAVESTPGAYTRVTLTLPQEALPAPKSKN